MLREGGGLTSRFYWTTQSKYPGHWGDVAVPQLKNLFATPLLNRLQVVGECSDVEGTQVQWGTAQLTARHSPEWRCLNENENPEAGSEVGRKGAPGPLVHVAVHSVALDNILRRRDVFNGTLFTSLSNKLLLGRTAITTR